MIENYYFRGSCYTISIDKLLRGCRMCKAWPEGPQRSGA